MACEARCSGACCRIFLAQGNEIRKQADRARLKRSRGERLSGMDREAIFMDDMLIYRASRYHDLPPELQALLNFWNFDHDPEIACKPDWQGERWEFFSCRRHDPETGDCTVYDQRPSMCRSYPGNYRDESCRHVGCTYKPIVALPVVF